MKVSLDRFEGPLDLLLALIRRNEMSIEDLPVAEITRQYLDYMRQASELDINLGAEFAYTAATLIQIKTRSLLPSHPALQGSEPDPKQELIRELLDYQQVRRAAAFLQGRLEVTGAVWSRPSGDELLLDVVDPAPPRPPEGRKTLLDVLELTRTALAVARQYRENAGLRERILAPGAGDIPIERMIAYIERLVEERRLPTVAERLFGEQSTLAESVVLFLAMLELCRAGRLGLEQSEPFGPMLVTAQ